ncbi:MAG: class II aldolase/adducin family protein, partial [Congregibacter sp.]|nr:class II aldolase/adducin family protein [Congregibacter sp.]
MATNDMNKTERELRIQLAACYRIFDHLGWSELIYNHITLKIPGEQEHFLINPNGITVGPGANIDV